MKRTIAFVALTFVAAGLIFAQGGPGAGPGSGSGVDMSRVRTISGPAVSVQIGFGMRYPSVTIGTTEIHMAPAWYLLDSNLVIKSGDWLSILAAPSNSADNTLYAVEVNNTTTGVRAILRDSIGLPLWSGGNGSRQMAGGATVGDAKIVSGTVEQLTMGPGIAMPNVTLKDSGGQLLNIRLGPEWLLLRSGLQLKAGETITVKYAVAAGCGNLVALTIANAAGTTVTLRDQPGGPFRQ